MSTTREEWEQDLGRAADMRPKKLSDKDEKYFQDVMAKLKALHHPDDEIRESYQEDTVTAMATPIQTSDPVTFYPNTPPPKQPGWPWVTPPVQIKPQRSRSFTEIYNMGLEISRQAATSFEEQTGQTIDQLTMAQLAVKIAKMLENW